MTRIAVVLFNLGGPDSPAAVKPFLLNLFRDPAILRVPFFVRPLLAQIIARARVKPATANYALLGGKSPLLELTQDQARALEAALAARGVDAKVFIAMRYWHPFALKTAQDVKAWNPDEVFLLPLYPQYSTTTTGSSVLDWCQAAVKVGLARQVTTLCCFYADPGYLAATAAMLRVALNRARAEATAPIRVLFSAHGLPETIVQNGDPYQHQVEQTVGVIRQAAADRVAVLVVPIAFVSEHSETLVELDVEYRELAEKLGVPGYFRAPAQNSDAGFIEALAELLVARREHGPGMCSFQGGRLCPATHRDCPMRVAS